MKLNNHVMAKIHMENEQSIEERFLIEKYPMRICFGVAEI